MAKIQGTILMIKEKKLLLIANNQYYITKGSGEVGQNFEFEADCALPMPSYLFAIASMEEDNLEVTLNFIQSKWFSK